jgi:hypothetical protein
LEVRWGANFLMKSNLYLCLLVFMTWEAQNILISYIKIGSRRSLVLPAVQRCHYNELVFH